MTQNEVDLTISFAVSRLISEECLGQILCKGASKRALCLERFIDTNGIVAQAYSTWTYHLDGDENYDNPYEFEKLFNDDDDLFRRNRVETE